MRIGWIKLHRRFLEWGWYKDINTKVVFIHLLLSANHTECEFEGITIKPGQVAIGRKSLAEAVGLSERQVRTALEHLKSTNEITTWSTNKFTVVTIERWGMYQVEDARSDQVIDQQEVKRATNERPTSDHNIRMKEYKNDNNDSYSYKGHDDRMKNIRSKSARILAEIEKGNY